MYVSKIRADQMSNYIDTVTMLIRCQLSLLGIPYSLGEDRDSGIEDDGHPGNIIGYYHTKQILFPWTEGDVVIGTLHMADDFIVGGKDNWLDRYTYPSIETYKFPWDHGAITVFDKPEYFVKILLEHYKETAKEDDKDA